LSNLSVREVKDISSKSRLPGLEVNNVWYTAYEESSGSVNVNNEKLGVVNGYWLLVDEDLVADSDSVSDGSD